MAVRDGLQGLDPYFVKMRDAARRVIRAGANDRPAVAMVREGLTVILDNEAEYLRRMDRVVGLFESEARGRVAHLRQMGWTVTALILATLVAIGLFILRPAAALIRRQIAELRQARDELEARVRERTRELELAGERHRASSSSSVTSLGRPRSARWPAGWPTSSTSRWGPSPTTPKVVWSSSRRRNRP